MILTGFPVLNCAYRTDALIPIPCCPLDCFRTWKREPYSNFAKTFGICSFTIPGPLSSTVRIRFGAGEAVFISIKRSGRIPASSQASSALSTASLIVVIRDRCSESNPSICLFFSKNSAMLIDFCFSASFSAIGGAGVCGIESLLIYMAGIVDICIGRVMYFRSAICEASSSDAVTEPYPGSSRDWCHRGGTRSHHRSPACARQSDRADPDQEY